jgi:septal ring factor EnvC (AmiA/AmiB activator)
VTTLTRAILILGVWAIDWGQLAVAMGFLAAAVTVVYSLYRNSPIGTATIELLNAQIKGLTNKVADLEATIIEQSETIADKDDAIHQAEKEILEREKTIIELEQRPKFEVVVGLQEQSLAILRAVHTLLDRDPASRAGDP